MPYAGCCIVFAYSSLAVDEADFLGDRIAILGGERVRCCGTSMFLKHRYERCWLAPSVYQ
jgi:hypothetical protein